MAINTEKNSYTLMFAIGLVVIVGTLLAAVDSSLKDKIRVNKLLEKQQNILYAIGINENEGNSVSFISAEKAEQEFQKYITKQIYIQNNNLLKPPTSYTIITFRNMNHIYGGAIYWRFMKLNTFNKTEINVNFKIFRPVTRILSSKKMILWTLYT